MNPVGIAAVVVLVAAMLLYRWRSLERAGVADPRTEWPYWAMGGIAIALSVLVTLGGRYAMLAIAPLIMVPLGVYLLRRSDEDRAMRGLDLRAVAWASIAGGILSLAVLLAGVALVR